MSSSFSTELVDACSHFAVLVRIQGQDSLGLKTLGRPFHNINGGITTLSASGVLLDSRSGFVLTSATLISPFLQVDGSSVLRKGTLIDILTNGRDDLVLPGMKPSDQEDKSENFWIPAKLISILRDENLHHLLKKFKSDQDWIVGWSRNTDSSSGHLGQLDLQRRDSVANSFWNGFEDLALLQIDFDHQMNGRENDLRQIESRQNESRQNESRQNDSRHLTSIHQHFHHRFYSRRSKDSSKDLPVHFDIPVVDTKTIRRGNPILFIGSPYGILSPSVFHNCAYPAMVSNILSQSNIHQDSQYKLKHKTQFKNGQKFEHPSSSLSSLSSSSSLDFSSSTTSSIRSALRMKTHTNEKNHQKINSMSSQNVVYNSNDHSGNDSSHFSCMILIDQPGLPGCEGGPVFDSAGSLIGILAPPLRKSDGSNVEVHLVLPITPFLSQLLKFKENNRSTILDRLTNSSFSTQSTSAHSSLLSDAGISKQLEYQLVPIDEGQNRQANQFELENQSMSTSIPSLISSVLPSIVVISVGSFWGSGVVVSSDGYLITSAHIFRPFLTPGTNPLQPVLQFGYRVDVRIDNYLATQPRIPAIPPSSSNSSSSQTGKESLWYRADLVYVSSSHLDVAIVKIQHAPTMKFLPLVASSSLSLGSQESRLEPIRDPEEGESIFVLGYALFGPSKKVMATCTSGVISRIAHLNGRPKLVQTNAAVNKGASGGAVIDSKGRFVALVTCNAMTKDGAIIPKINFSIPLNLLLPINDFIKTLNIDYLKQLEMSDPECEALWKISSPNEELEKTPRQSIVNTEKPHTTIPAGMLHKASKLREFLNEAAQKLDQSVSDVKRPSSKL